MVIVHVIVVVVVFVLVIVHVIVVVIVFIMVIVHVIVVVVVFLIALIHDDVFRSVPPPSLAFKMQMCSQRIEIEKNTSKEGERSVKMVHGSEAWW